MRSLSVFDFNFFSSLAQNFFCFKKASTLCSGTDIKAVSDPEKNADKRNKIIKITIEIGSIWYKKILFENKKIKLIRHYILFHKLFSMVLWKKPPRNTGGFKTLLHFLEHLDFVRLRFFVVFFEIFCFLWLCSMNVIL